MTFVSTGRIAVNITLVLDGDDVTAQSLPCVPVAILRYDEVFQENWRENKRKMGNYEKIKDFFYYYCSSAVLLDFNF